jgi:preprotein translocase subunit YajC
MKKVGYNMSWNLILPLIIIVAMFWFMSRQQKKQREQQQTMQNSLQKGSEVVTIGGLHAVVDSVDNAAKTVDLDAEGVILTFELSAIRTIKNPVAPVADKPTVDDLKPAETVEETEKITDDTDKPSDSK